MREQIAILLDLRRLDDQLHALRRSLEARQADWQRRRLEADLVRETHAQERARLEAAARRKREAELEVKSCRARKTQFETQLQGVKTNVEYQALLREIAAMEARAREWEDAILETMELEEATQGTAERLRGELAEKERAADEEGARVEREIAAARAQEAELEARRVALIEGLGAEARGRYERLRAAKGETAIVAVVQRSCGGCHYNLPPQTVNEVRRAERLILCEGCGRILVWVTEAS
jgi:predicted  nucleic acid-binding Zn-ribbon protein